MRSGKAPEEKRPSTQVERASTRRNGENTRRRILEAAEILFAEQGLRGTSLRAVARAAGVRQPSLHYHFRDKREVFLAALELRVIPLYRERLARLDELEAAGRGEDLEGILSASQGPVMRACREEIAPGVSIVNLIYRAIVDADPEWDSLREAISDPVRERYVAAFARALPALGRVELLERLSFLQGALAGLYLDRSEDEMNRPWRELHDDPAAFEKRVVALCCTVLRSPPMSQSSVTAS